MVRGLEDNDEDLAALRYKAETGALTLLFAARDVDHNATAALKGFLESGPGNAV